MLAAAATKQPRTPGELLKSELAHPIVLDYLFLDRYGVEWLGWELETVLAHAGKDFGVKNVPDSVQHKLQACRTLHLVDTPWTNWEVFLPCCVALNGVYPDFHHMQAPTVAEAMVAVDCMNRVREDVEWSEEVKQFLAVLHKWDDVLAPQNPLEFVLVDTADLHVDIWRVQAAWPEVKKSGKVPSLGEPERVQLQRMLDAYLYLEESRQHLDAQMKVVAP